MTKAELGVEAVARRLWAAVRDAKRKQECVVTLNFDTVTTAATLLEAASLPQDKRIAPSGIAARMRWYADHAEKRPVNIELLKADCAEAAGLLASHYKRIAVLEEALREILAKESGAGYDPIQALGEIEHIARAALNGGSNDQG